MRRLSADRSLCPPRRSWLFLGLVTPGFAAGAVLAAELHAVEVEVDLPEASKLVDGERVGHQQLFESKLFRLELAFRHLAQRLIGTDALALSQRPGHFLQNVYLLLGLGC